MTIPPVFQATQRIERVECPACGGAGGGPIGRAGSAWDDDDYVCPRCDGEGMIAGVALSDDVLSTRPGIVKVAREVAEEVASKQKATG